MKKKTRYRFVGQWNGIYHWESTTRMPGDSRVEQWRCPVGYFWGDR